MAGKNYVDRKRRQKPEKGLKAACSCRKLQCSTKVTDEDRLSAFNYYRNLGSKGEQRVFLLAYTSSSKVARRRPQTKKSKTTATGSATGENTTPSEDVTEEAEQKNTKCRDFTHRYSLPVNVDGNIETVKCTRLCFLIP